MLRDSLADSALILLQWVKAKAIVVRISSLNAHARHREPIGAQPSARVHAASLPRIWPLRTLIPHLPMGRRESRGPIKTQGLNVKCSRLAWRLRSQMIGKMKGFRGSFSRSTASL